MSISVQQKELFNNNVSVPIFIMDQFSPVEVMKRCSVILWILLFVLICVRGELTLQTSHIQ